MAKKGNHSQKSVETIQHKEATRRHIPTAEYQSVLSEEQQTPIQVAYQRRNPDLDPQLVWRGKDLLDWSDLVVQAPPLYIQEKIHPKVLIDDLRTKRKNRKRAESFSSSICSPISTGCRTETPRPSFTSTRPTGATA